MCNASASLSSTAPQTSPVPFRGKRRLSPFHAPRSAAPSSPDGRRRDDPSNISRMGSISRRAFLCRHGSLVPLATARFAPAIQPGPTARAAGRRGCPPGHGRRTLAQALPLAPSQVIVVNDAAYVIDCGDGVARQLVLAGIAPPTLRAIFITTSTRITTPTTATSCCSDGPRGSKRVWTPTVRRHCRR